MSTEPQSIIHQVVRMEQSFVRAIKSMGRRRRCSRSVVCNPADASITLEKGNTSDWSEYTCPESLASSSHHCNLSSTGIRTENYRTINQNEFLTECMISPESDEVAFVHFFVKGSEVSEAICQQMNQLKNVHHHCHFLRIDASLTPFVSAKLKVGMNEPSVVAMKNGKLVNRIRDFSSKDCSELATWITTVELLRMFQ